MPNVAVTVEINNVTGVKLNPKPQTEIRFDVNANLEEKERRAGQCILTFELIIATKPSVVKFGVAGIATLEGKDSEIQKLLENDQETNVPRVLGYVYQHAFTAIYLLATLLKSPYPPPNLLHAPKQAVAAVATPEEDITTIVAPSSEADTETKERTT